MQSMKKQWLSVAILAGAACAAAANPLHTNGPVVDANGKSVLMSGGTTIGFGAQTASNNRVADDFTVTGNGWLVQGLDFFSYQTGATGFTFTQATWSIRSGDVNNGTVVASGVTDLTNGGLMGYRVTSTTLTSTARGIYKAQADVADFHLSAGHYWLTWSLSGTLASGPWVPPTSDGSLGNAMQSIGVGAFNTLSDQSTLRTVELPFAINGVAAVPEPGTYALMLGGLAGLVAVARRRKPV